MNDFEHVLKFQNIFQVERGAETVIVTLLPEIDQARYNELHVETGRVTQILAASEIRHVIIDLNYVGYLNSVFIGTIVQMGRQIGHGPGRIILCNVSDNVRGILESMNLFNLWSEVDTREDAIHEVSES